jgi:hypothetical protein
LLWGMSQSEQAWLECMKQLGVVGAWVAGGSDVHVDVNMGLGWGVGAVGMEGCVPVCVSGVGKSPRRGKCRLRLRV